MTPLTQKEIVDELFLKFTKSAERWDEVEIKRVIRIAFQEGRKQLADEILQMLNVNHNFIYIDERASYFHKLKEKLQKEVEQ